MLLAGELEIAADEDKHAAGGARRLAIDGGDAVLALLEGETGELSDDVLGALDLLSFEGKHRRFLIEVGQSRSISIESGVVVLHKCLRY